jgi:hypothetical protein
VGIACGDRTVLRTSREGQEVFATGHRAEAHACVQGTKAYAMRPYTRAHADAPDTVAIAASDKTIAYARRKGSTAYATVAGAKVARGCNPSGILITDFIQNVWPNHTQSLESTVS